MSKAIGEMASKAKLDYSINVLETSGLRFSFFGYSDKLLSFVQQYFEILTKVMKESFDERELKMIVEKTKRKVKNEDVQPADQAKNNHNLVIRENYFHCKQKYTLLSDFDFSKFATYV
jgi:hypothetical protein